MAAFNPRAIFIAAVLLFPAGLSQAQQPTSSASSVCKSLSGADFSTILDAPTQVTAADDVAAKDDIPAYCRIQGYVSPNVGFEMHLPASSWNGKLLKQGCGGFCGGTLALACAAPVRKGYACIVSDMGHKSTALDAKWAYNNLQAEVDFAYRSTHVVALAAKGIAEKFYGLPPRKSYYTGCSTGGRQGLVEAQRFPWDFDGIIAGAPVINETGDGMTLLWNVLAARDANGNTLLSPADVRAVHAAAVARCDLDDGVKDGIIGDPRKCKFQPSEMQCKGRKADGCLTKDQAAAVSRIYQGPVNSKGERLYTGSAMPGSELNWIRNYVPEGAGPSVYEGFMTNLFGYMSFMPDPGPGWKMTDFDWDRDPKRLGMMEALYSGENPDLRRFKAAGGKMIVYQGWADQSVLPENIIDYYETTTRTMGGKPAMDEFFRLFMVPGMNHCSGGEGAYAIDYLTYIEAWVENGAAPDVMQAAHIKDGVSGRITFPVPPENIAFTRPVYPYPLQATYKGSGDVNDGANFQPKSPQ